MTDRTTITGDPDAQIEQPPDDATRGFRCDVCQTVFWHTGDFNHRFNAAADFRAHVYTHDTVPLTDTPSDHLTVIEAP